MNFIDIYVYIDKIEFYIFKIKSDQKEEILQDKIIIPRSFNVGDKLNYIRKILLTIIKRYNVEYASINIEDNMGVDIIDIVKIEGVLQELLSSCGVII